MFGEIKIIILQNMHFPRAFRHWNESDNTHPWHSPRIHIRLIDNVPWYTFLYTPYLKSFDLTREDCFIFIYYFISKHTEYLLFKINLFRVVVKGKFAIYVFKINLGITLLYQWRGNGKYLLSIEATIIRQFIVREQPEQCCKSDQW